MEEEGIEAKMRGATRGTEYGTGLGGVIDALLPTQYFESFRRKAHLEPEKRLMFAVLEDAVACFQKYALARDAKGRTLFREAQEWILEEGGSDWVFSFRNICEEVLKSDPDYVREGLMRWKEKRLSESPPPYAKRKYVEPTTR